MADAKARNNAIRAANKSAQDAALAQSRKVLGQAPGTAGRSPTATYMGEGKPPTTGTAPPPPAPMAPPPPPAAPPGAGSLAGLLGAAPAPLDALNGPTSPPLRNDLGSRQPPSLAALLQGLRY